MKTLLILMCAVMCHYCNGYMVIDGEMSEEIVTRNDTSVEYILDTTNDTSSNHSLPKHGFFKKVGGGIKGGIKSIKSKIGNLKNKIGSFKDNSGSGKSIGGGRYIVPHRIGTNSGSGVKNLDSLNWALLGIGVILVVSVGGLTWYYCQRSRKKTENKCDFRQVNEM